jgi:hypothetical protein
MNTFQSEPMDNIQVHTTTDYFLFKPVNGNRNKNMLHLNRLKKSISDNYLFTAIIVNENYEIIDGQHRFQAIKELKLPLNYIIMKGYTLREVQILNANSKNWNAEDYLEGYCNLGFKDYIVYRDFKNKYNFGHNECMSLLSNSRDVKLNLFYDGKFKVHNLLEAEKKADLILLTEPYYKNCRRRSYVYAMISLFNNPNFIFSDFLQKLKIQPTALQDCNNQTSYLTLIEEIYNYRSRNKVNLRY